jgi:hypothetical protein
LLGRQVFYHLSHSTNPVIALLSDHYYLPVSTKYNIRNESSDCLSEISLLQYAKGAQAIFLCASLLLVSFWWGAIQQGITDGMLGLRIVSDSTGVCISVYP